MKEKTLLYEVKEENMFFTETADNHHTFIGIKEEPTFTGTDEEHAFKRNDIVKSQL